MSVLLLVPTMTFTRAVVVLVQLIVAGQSCLDFIECFCSFSSSLRMLPCMEVCHSLRYVLECGLRMKGDSICLMYDCPKRLTFIASMGLKVHPHFYTILINTLRSVFFSLFPTTTYLSISHLCPLFH